MQPEFHGHLQYAVLWVPADVRLVAVRKVLIIIGVLGRQDWREHA